MSESQQQIRVWDPLVRIGHWTLAAAFLIAYFTAEELEGVHIAAGYWVGGYVIVRLIWGFIGSSHARFSDFVRGPRAVLGYLTDLFKGRPPHHVGHNPAGGAMVVALLLCLAATTFTGLMVQADSENEGPLAAWLGNPGQSTGPALVVPRTSKSSEAREERGENDETKESDSAYGELHGFFANLTLALVVLHLLGVIAGSLVHRENLVRAMITGCKPAHPESRSPGSLHPVGKG